MFNNIVNQFSNVPTLITISLIVCVAILALINYIRYKSRGIKNSTDNLHIFDKLEEIRKLLEEQNKLLKK